MLLFPGRPLLGQNGDAVIESGVHRNYFKELKLFKRI